MILAALTIVQEVFRMSISPSFPGIYVQELPLSAHTITPAPTSITAFVGYTHPWRTAQFNVARQIFSFTDYETYFGGLYTSGLIPSDVARAVFAFFLNGGNNAYVVGLQPEAKGTALSPQFGSDPSDLAFMAQIVPDPGAPAIGIQFQALEPADVVPMTAMVTNFRASNPQTPPAATAYDTFDLVVTYGTRVEAYRGLNISIAQGQPKSLDKMINGVSSLVRVQPMTGTSYGAFPSAVIPALPAMPAPANFVLGTIGSPGTGLPAGFTTTFNASDFLSVFKDNSSLDNVEIFNLLLVPGVADNVILSAALAFAERKRAFTIVDPPAQATAFQIPSSPLPTIDSLMTSMPTSQNGALYFPYLKTTDPISALPIAVAPSGYIAGAYAMTDAARGVWKAPAGIGTPLLGTTGPVPNGVMNDPQQGVLNLHSINCIRTFTGTGTVVYGARTLVAENTAFAQSKYVPVRRMTLFIEQTLVANLKWVVFEPNDEPLWLAIKSSIEAFLLSLFNQQALQGSKPSDAFQVKCDSTTTTPADQQNGIVNIVVGVALLKPAEFVIIKIAQLAGQTAGS
jgi:phage tail sheath protein FI